MDAFPTPEADSGRARAKVLDQKFASETGKSRLIERLAFVLVSCTILFGGVIAMERHEARIALINQESSIAWNR